MNFHPDFGLRTCWNLANFIPVSWGRAWPTTESCTHDGGRWVVTFSLVPIWYSFCFGCCLLTGQGSFVKVLQAPIQSVLVLHWGRICCIPQITEAAKEAIWLQQLMCDLKWDVTQLNSLLIDNLSAQLLVNTVHNSNAKHIDVPPHFIRECVTNGSRSHR